MAGQNIIDAISTIRPGMVPISGRTEPLNALSDGIDIAQDNRFSMPIVAGVQHVSLVYANWYLSTAPGDTADGTPVEVDGTDELSVSAAIITPDARLCQLTVGGRARWTIAPGGQVSTDPLDVDIPASAGAFSVRTYVEVAAGGKFPLGRFAYDGGDGVQNFTSSPVDNTLSSSGAGLGTGVSGYSPVAVLGAFEASMQKPIVALWGDSITVGTGDTDISVGWAARALLRDGIPFIKLARGSERAKDVGPDPTRRARRFLLAGGCTRAAIFYGTNDYNAGDTAPQTEANLVAMWRASADGGMKAVAATFTPRTTSTDSWATVANQTAVAGGSERTAINDWIRDGAPLDASTLAPVATGTSAAVRSGQPAHPLLGWIEIADVVESARNSTSGSRTTPRTACTRMRQPTRQWPQRSIRPTTLLR